MASPMPPGRQGIPLIIQVPVVMSEANEALTDAIARLNATMEREVERSNAVITAAHAEFNTALDSANAAFFPIEEPAAKILVAEQTAARTALAEAHAAYEARMASAARKYTEVTDGPREIHQHAVRVATKHYDEIVKTERSAFQREKVAQIKQFRETEHRIKVELKHSGITLQRRKGGA